MVDRFGQKKSDAEIPMKENRKPSRVRSPATTRGRAVGEACSYHFEYGKASKVFCRKGTRQKFWSVTRP